MMQSQRKIHFMPNRDIVTNSNYFDNLNPNFEENDYFYDNLLSFYQNSKLTIEECANELYNKMKNRMNLNSDIDEIFVQVKDADLFRNNNCVCTKILLLIYDKLDILKKLEDETTYQFFCDIGYVEGENFSDFQEEMQEIYSGSNFNGKILKQFVEQKDLLFRKLD
jgi:hypothetical protein